MSVHGAFLEHGGDAVERGRANRLIARFGLEPGGDALFGAADSQTWRLLVDARA